ncbi:DMT family transporter [Aquisphaera insulae]|uniref:DMT family transporter n=1 Tax=Aquisphaera insulae TaxID=2712864 RepID=UPI0013EABEC7|nr:DMT family transporter [Aquisphaera insulae]
MSVVTTRPKKAVPEAAGLNAKEKDVQAILTENEPEVFVPELESSVRPDLRGYIYLALMIVIGSTTSPFATVVVRDLPVSVLPLLRFGFAGLCLIPFLTDRGALWRMLRHDPVRIAVVAACCVPINQSFFLNSVRFGPNSHVGLFYAVCPLIVWVLAWAIGEEALDLGRLWSVLASIAGVLVIGLGNAWGGDGGTPEQTRSVMIADLLLVGAVISWGAYLTLSKPLITRYGALPVLAGTFLLGCLMELPIAAATMPHWLPTLGRVSTSAWVCLGLLGLFITPVNLALQNLSLRRLDASQVATFSNVAPVLTVVWGVWFFHERLSPALIVGGALTLLGVFWASRPGPGRQAASRGAA